jgi:hypothetical protein
MFKATESYALSLPKLQESALPRITEALLPGGGSYLEVKIAAIHEGLTRNYTNYSREGLTNKSKNDQGHPGGLESWTQPYNAPILKNHDDASVDNTIGRVVKAEWVERAGKERGHVQLTAHITAPEAIEKFLRGEYQTGSIGMDVDAAHCSVCGENLRESPWGGAFHEHQRGKWYIKGEKGADTESQWLEAKRDVKGAKLAHINVGNVWAREYSMVATPSDAHSKVKSLEIKEMALKGEGQESINLLTPAFLQESLQDLDQDLPEVDKDGNPIVETEPVTELSTAELIPHFYETIGEDASIAYFELAALCAAVEAGFEATSLLIKINDQDRKLNAPEIKKVLTHIVNTNEDLEGELNMLAEAVLSTENSAKLPDSSFALVKTVDGKTLRALPYRNAEAVVDSEQLLTALAHAAHIPTFTVGERAKAIKKLTAAARKAQIAKPATAEEKIAEAKTLVEGLAQVLTTAEIAALTPAVDATELETIKAELTEAQTQISQLEAETDAHLETIADLTESVENATNGHKGSIITMLLELEGVEDADKAARLKELNALSLEELWVAGEEKLSEQRLLVTAPIERSGIAGGTGDIEPSAVEKLSNATILSAHFGSKRAARTVAEAINRHK